MRAKLQVRAVEPAEPEVASRAIASELLAGLPRQRPVTVALVALGPQPGLTPTPWLLDGLLEALLEAERTPVNLLCLGDAEAGEAALRRAGRRSLLDGVDTRELVERPSRDRVVPLKVPGQRRPLAIPRELIGSSLILVTPLLLRVPGEASEAWLGPLGLGLAELARAWGFADARRGGARRRGLLAGPGLRAPEPRERRHAGAVGQSLCAEVFASAAALVDGSWAGAVAPRAEATAGRKPKAGISGSLGRALGGKASEPTPAGLVAELVSPELGLGLAELGRLELDALVGVDDYLLGALGAESRGSSTRPGPELSESPGRWPQLSLAPSARPARLADRAIAGIRSQGQRLQARARGGVGAQAALPARVPGRLSSLWTRRWYGPELRMPGGDRS